MAGGNFDRGYRSKWNEETMIVKLCLRWSEYMDWPERHWDRGDVHMGRRLCAWKLHKLERRRTWLNCSRPCSPGEEEKLNSESSQHCVNLILNLGSTASTWELPMGSGTTFSVDPPGLSSARHSGGVSYKDLLWKKIKLLSVSQYHKYNSQFHKCFKQLFNSL